MSACSEEYAMSIAQRQHTCWHCESHYSYVHAFTENGMHAQPIINARCRFACNAPAIFFVNRLFFQLYTQTTTAENYSNVIQNEEEGKTKEERTRPLIPCNEFERLNHRDAHAITTFTQSSPIRCKVDAMHLLLLLSSIERANKRTINMPLLPFLVRFACILESAFIWYRFFLWFTDSISANTHTQLESISNRNVKFIQRVCAHVPNDWHLQLGKN